VVWQLAPGISARAIPSTAYAYGFRYELCRSSGEGSSRIHEGGSQWLHRDAGRALSIRWTGKTRAPKVVYEPHYNNLIVCACVFGGALLGMFLRRVLLEHHLNADFRSTVNLGIGLIGTMSGIASACWPLPRLVVAGTSGFGWEQSKSQREQAQGDELWTDGGDREAAAEGSARVVEASGGRG